MSRGKNSIIVKRESRNGPILLVVLTSLLVWLISSQPSWAQGQTFKGSIQKPGAAPPQKPAEKPETREAPKQPPQAPTSAPASSPVAKAAPPAAINFELEMKKLESLLQLNDKNADAYYNRGWLYEYKGDLQRALQDYSKAIELDKKQKDAYHNRGLLYAKMKKYEEALKDFSELIKLEPAVADGYCNRGSVQLQLGKPDLALADYEAAIKINAKDADLFYNRGLIFLAKGEKEKGMEDMKKSAQMFHDKARKEYPQFAPQLPPGLKKAAMDCQAGEFLDFMPSETRQRTQRFLEIKAKLDKAVDELEKTATQMFGKKFERQKEVMQFSFDRDPKPFVLKLEFAYKNECEVLARFQACLENPDLCEEFTVENSPFTLKKADGAWKLVDKFTPKDWNQLLVVGDSVLQLAQWGNKFLVDSKGKMSSDECISALARGYLERITEMSNKVKEVK